MRTTLASVISIGALSLAPWGANAEALSVTCSGAPSETAITWSAATTGGIAPIALLWGSGATTSSITTNETPGVHLMTIQATDASSTVATSSCVATIAWPVPALRSFLATPASIVAGQSATLSWDVDYASSTIISGLGTVLGNATTVSPTVTTTYTLTATNPSGAASATTTIYVTATSTPNGIAIAAQIQSLLAQIRNLQAQIIVLLRARAHATTTPSNLPGKAHAFGHEEQCEKQRSHGFRHSIASSIFSKGCADEDEINSNDVSNSHASPKKHVESKNSSHPRADHGRDSDD